VPWMRSTGFYPLWLVEGTPIMEPVDQHDPSPLAVLISMGHGPAYDYDTITARMPTVEERELFDMPRGVPVMINLRTSHDREGRPVRCTLDVHPAHRFELMVEQDYTREGPASCPHCTPTETRSNPT
jgi:GntR family transcriptional regulator